MMTKRALNSLSKILQIDANYLTLYKVKNRLLTDSVETDYYYSIAGSSRIMKYTKTMRRNHKNETK